jgi:hypothetical protein
MIGTRQNAECELRLPPGHFPIEPDFDVKSLAERDVARGKTSLLPCARGGWAVGTNPSKCGGGSGRGVTSEHRSPSPRTPSSRTTARSSASWTAPTSRFSHAAADAPAGFRVIRLHAQASWMARRWSMAEISTVGIGRESQRADRGATTGGNRWTAQCAAGDARPGSLGKVARKVRVADAARLR